VCSLLCAPWFEPAPGGACAGSASQVRHAAQQQDGGDYWGGACLRRSRKSGISSGSRGSGLRERSKLPLSDAAARAGAAGVRGPSAEAVADLACGLGVTLVPAGEDGTDLALGLSADVAAVDAGAGAGGVSVPALSPPAFPPVPPLCCGGPKGAPPASSREDVAGCCGACGETLVGVARPSDCNACSPAAVSTRPSRSSALPPARGSLTLSTRMRPLRMR
jgi:hypothetical protein